MPLVPMKELLSDARKNKYAIAAFEYWSLDSAQAIASAAAELDQTIIFQVGPLECDFAGIGNLVQIAKMVTEQYKITAALHLDHGDTLELVEEAIKNGFTSVMIDASDKPFEENISITKKAVEMASKAGVSVEGELGKILGNEGNMETSQDLSEEDYQTDPQQAAEYVQRTGIDALAVAIGSAHGFYVKAPKLNIRRLDEINKSVSIPLVLHGGTGINDEQIRQSINHGISKINICTEFVAAYGKQYSATQNEQGFKYSIPSLFAPSQKAGKQVVTNKIELFSMK